MQSEWANPVWHQVGRLGVICFLALIALVFMARLWFKGQDKKRAKIAAGLLGNIGGSRVGREALSELSRRPH